LIDESNFQKKNQNVRLNELPNPKNQKIRINQLSLSFWKTKSRFSPSILASG